MPSFFPPTAPWLALNVIHTNTTEKESEEKGDWGLFTCRDKINSWSMNELSGANWRKALNNKGQNKTQTLVVLHCKREARRERRSYLGDVFLFIHPSVSLLLSFSLFVWWFLWKWGHLNSLMVHHTEKALNPRLNHHNFRQNTEIISCKPDGLGSISIVLLLVFAEQSYIQFIWRIPLVNSVSNVWLNNWITFWKVVPLRTFYSMSDVEHCFPTPINDT